MSDLDSIAAEGAALEAAAPGAAIPPAGDQPQQPAASPDENNVAFWAMIPATIGRVLCMALPELRPVYSEENCKAWGATANAVAEKRGWNAVAAAPEAALLLASLPFVLATGGAIIARQRAAKERARVEQPAGTVKLEDPAASPAAASASAMPRVNDELSG